MIHKAKISKEYTKISNDFIKDEVLSISAKMVGILLLSLPSNWKVNISYLAKTLSIGEQSIRKAIKELIDNKILERYQEKKKGKFSDEVHYRFLGEIQEDEIFTKEQEIKEKEIIENLEFSYKVNESLQEPKNSNSHRLTNSPMTEILPTYKERINYKKRESILRQSKKVIDLSLVFKKPKKEIDLNLDFLSKTELESCEAFFAYRKEKDKKLTLSTKKAIINKLKAYKANGEDICKIIANSIERGWSGLFPSIPLKQKYPTSCHLAQIQQKNAKTQKRDILHNDLEDKALQEHNFIQAHLKDLNPIFLPNFKNGYIVPLSINGERKMIQKVGDLLRFA
ncbi:hypothetical protein B6S12_07580 [Helicobacter valdiviensis]|uniref:Helix-turn-helix domain-containing protein n=1 Tax=Helicobacter valdiviensis TaxID=1458358 RepID=A0A2W6PM18_9HELI|nr:helix-turn-helix domain-containing protein [Helicobacter valdiviensis]PZT47713.1 hypothetical protein B6S12_07580 [Helicobacter valdiviensis]